MFAPAMIKVWAISNRSLLTAIERAVYPLGVTEFGSALKERSKLTISTLPLNEALMSAVCLLSLTTGSLMISGFFYSVVLMFGISFLST